MFDEIKSERNQDKKKSGQDLNQKSAPSFNNSFFPQSENKSKDSSSGPEKKEISKKANTFGVPELIKKDTLKKVEDDSQGQEKTKNSSSKEKIYVMPDKFRQDSRQESKRSKKGIKIFLIILFAFLIGGGAYYYFWAQQYIEKESVDISEEEIKKELLEEEEAVSEEEEAVSEEEIPSESSEPSEKEEAEKIIFQEKNIEIEVKNQEENLISKFNLYLPEGSLPAETTIEASGVWEQGNVLEDDLYKSIGAIFEIESNADLVFSESVDLEILYGQELVEEFWEEEIALGYFKNETWTPLLSNVNLEENVVKAELDFLPANTFGLIVEKDKIIPEIEKLNIAPQISSTLDDDNDGLTNIEESLFSTESNNPDTDADGISDGQEILNSTNPSQIDGQLATSGLIKVYVNPTFSYSLFYPSSWLTRPIPETDNQEVLIVTNTGEFFSINVENNPEELSPTDWYLR